LVVHARARRLRAENVADDTGWRDGIRLCHTTPTTTPHDPEDTIVDGIAVSEWRSAIRATVRTGALVSDRDTGAARFARIAIRLPIYSANRIRERRAYAGARSSAPAVSRSARAPGVAADGAPSAGHGVATALKLDVAGTTRLQRSGTRRSCAHAGGTGSGTARPASGTASSGLSASTALADAASRAAPPRAPGAALAQDRTTTETESQANQEESEMEPHGLR
jgi:hypothetical protein